MRTSRGIVGHTREPAAPLRVRTPDDAHLTDRVGASPKPPQSIAMPPLRWHRSFPGRLDQAAHVRRFVAVLLADHPRGDDAVLAVGELAANALQHTLSAAPGGVLVVEVRRWHAEGRVAVSVTDQGGPTEPRPADPDYLAGHGRGLHLIAATAAWWGWSGDATGRTVTAVFTYPPR
ncbi:MAG TPA: ATP-binding protein [Streptosporangiaceae bacterium]